MKKIAAMLAVVVSLCLFVSQAVAAESMSGMIKKVDQKGGTITFAKEGSTDEQVLTVDKSVNLKKVKANEKAQLTVDGGVVKEIKAEAKGRSPGY